MEIQQFENAQFGKIRGMNIDGEPWFAGKDVAIALGYTNPQKAIRDHVDDDDRTVNDSFTVNGTSPILINYSGLYSLILSSKLPQAREFKHWVTAVVLPQIRKTGGYIPVKAEDDEKTILCRAIQILKRTVDEKDALLEKQEPKVQFANAITASNGEILVRELAKLLTQNGIPIGQNRLFGWLRHHGYLFKRDTSPIQEWVEKGIFSTHVTLIATNHGTIERITTYVTGKGQKYFVDGFLSGRFSIDS